MLLEWRTRDDSLRFTLRVIACARAKSVHVPRVCTLCMHARVHALCVCERGRLRGGDVSCLNSASSHVADVAAVHVGAGACGRAPVPQACEVGTVQGHSDEEEKVGGPTQGSVCVACRLA